MKTTMVPAQVTTVEDKIAGNISLQQLLLLSSPIFIGVAVYVLFPPMIKLNALKVAISSFIFLVFASMAIRIKGKLLLEWLVVIVRYNVRPRFYIFNKNDHYLRPSAKKIHEEDSEEAEIKKQPKMTLPHLPPLSTPEIVRIENVITDPRANFNFTSRKGKLNVHITEIK